MPSDHPARPSSNHPARRARNTISEMTQAVVQAVGSAVAVVIATLIVAAWVGVGVAAGFSARWLDLLVAVAAATTFIMVFFIQHSTARESRAVLLKLDELLDAIPHAREDLINLEKLPLHQQEDLEDRGTRNM